MSRPTLDDLARALAQRLLSEQACQCETEHARFHRHLTRLLAVGQPVSPEVVATTLRLSADEVVATLRQIPDLEFDEEGNIVGTGLSLIPTPHQFSFNDRRMFTWCALDTLIYPLILQQEARVESRCLVTGKTIRLLVTPERVAFLDPVGAVISIPIPEAACRCDRSTFCDQGHFFCSPLVASTFLSQHPDALLLPVADAYQFGQKFLTYKEALLREREEQTEKMDGG